MAKVILGENEYEYESLTDNAKAVLNSIKSVDAQIKFKNQEINILGAAKAMYALKLKGILERDEASPDDSTWIEELGDTIQFD